MLGRYFANFKHANDLYVISKNYFFILRAFTGYRLIVMWESCPEWFYFSLLSVNTKSLILTRVPCIFYYLYILTNNAKLTFYSLLVTWCTNSLTFNNCTLCPHCTYIFCIYLRTNSDLCHLQHKLIGFYSRYEKCLQRGTDWIFK